MVLPNVLFRMNDRRVYLTFDDGPDPEVTPRLLDVLAQYGIPATFFFVGKKVAAEADLVRRAHAEGHAVGNHAYSHTCLVGRGRQRLRREIVDTDDVLAQVTGQRPTLFRPPYGWFGPGLLRLLRVTGHRLVLWSASARDYRLQPHDHLVERLVKIIRPGQIVLLHDGHRYSPHMLAALHTALEIVRARGVAFARLPT